MVSVHPRISFTSLARSTLAPVSLFGPHRLDGIELRRSRRGVDAEQEARPAGGGEGEYHRPGRDARRNFEDLSRADGEPSAEEHARDAAEAGERHRLDQE